MMGRRGADAPSGPGLQLDSGSTAVIVSAGQVLGLVMRPGRRRHPPAGFRPGRPLSW